MLEIETWAISEKLYLVQYCYSNMYKFYKHFWMLNLDTNQYVKHTYRYCNNFQIERTGFRHLDSILAQLMFDWSKRQFQMTN